MIQSHLFHPDAPYPAMQQDLEQWPVIRGSWGDLGDTICAGFAVLYEGTAVMLLKRQTRLGPHKWHIIWNDRAGFYGSAAGWNDGDGLSLRPGDDRRVKRSPAPNPQ